MDRGAAAENTMNTLYAISMYNFDLQCRGSFPWEATLLLGLLAAGLVVTFYVKEWGRLPLVPRVFLATVRLAIVVAVAFLMLRPVLVYESRTERARPVSVLIDVSESMNRDDARPNLQDQFRSGIAFGLIEPVKGMPSEVLLTSLVNPVKDKIPEKPTRIEVARAALTNEKLDLFRKLRQTAGPLDVSTFGTNRTARDWLMPDWLETLSANESQTRLVDAAYELLNRDDNEAPAAIVYVTDGRDNASTHSLDDLARECARRKVPVFVYGVGSSSYGQLRIKDVVVPETLFVDDTVAVAVRYMVRGIKEGKVEITLHQGGREVASKEVPVQEGDDLRETLTFVPVKEDAGPRKKQELTATIKVTTGGGGAVVETLKDEVTRPAQVVDKKLKVLVIDSLPRYDFKFLQRALLRDRRVEARFYLTEGDKAAMRSGPPWMVDFSRELNGTLNMSREEFRKTLFDFDLLILGDVPGKYFSDEQQEVIKEFVTEGGGMIQIAGRWHAPAAWASEKGDKNKKSPVGDVLPVELDAVRFPIQAVNNPSPFVPVLAPGASRTTIVTLEDDPHENAALWGKKGSALGLGNDKQLKPLYWFYPVLKTKPAADVFLTHPTARTPAPDDKPMPLLVGHYYGKGYVLFVGFDDTWRWRFNSAEKYFGRFWSQAVYTAGVPRTVGTKLTQLSLDTTDPQVGETGQIYARIFNENYKLLTDEEIDATLEKLDADPNAPDRSVAVKLRKLPGQDGEYVAPVPFDHAGRYKLTVDPKNKTPASLQYRVSLPPTHEKAPGGLDEDAMRKLCEATGGKFYREEDLTALPNDVKPQSVKQVTREEVLLWNRWPLFLLIGLLSLEWFVRKFNGLS
jgi:hypothetical protein